MTARSLQETSLIRQVVEAAAPGAVNLALGIPGHHPPARIFKALSGLISDNRLGYTSNAGMPELRRLVAGRRPLHGADGSSAIVTVGSQQALALAILGLCGPGDEVVIPRWGYPSYESLSVWSGAVVRRAEPGEITGTVSDRTRLVVVASPSNPTGAIVSKAVLDELAGMAARRGFYLLSDETYQELYFGKTAPPWPEGKAVLHVGTLSKSLGLTGWRIGWLVGPPELVRHLLPLHQHWVTCAPTPSQHLAIAGLSLGDEHLNPIRQLYAVRWQRVRSHLERIEGIDWIEPEGGFYVFVNVSKRIHRPTLDWAFALARRGQVVVAPGEAFGPDGGGWVRISFSVPEKVLMEGLKRFREALED